MMVVRFNSPFFALMEANVLAHSTAAIKLRTSRQVLFSVLILRECSDKNILLA